MGILGVSAEALTIFLILLKKFPPLEKFLQKPKYSPTVWENLNF
jgi:hypothetical protein